LKERLEAGAWEPGSLFPSERELEERFGVSRSVVRPALAMLVDDGEILRVQGSGTFVASPKARVPVCGLLQTLFDPPTVDLGLGIVGVARHRHDARVAELLGLDDGDPELTQVTAIVSVGEPIGVLDSYVPLRDAPWLPALAQDLRKGRGTGEAPKLRLSSASISVESSRLGEYTSSLLEVSAGGPALVATVIQHGIPAGSRRPRPVEFARLVYLGARARLEGERT
jgi:DNA-binding GntR family transcriptional regulator